MPLTKAEIDARSYRKHHKTRLRKAANYRRRNRVRINKLQRRSQASRYASFIVQPMNRLTTLFKKAVTRARIRGLTFDWRVLTRLRQKPPSRCTCCKRKLDYSCGRGRKRDSSPSLDRKNNRAGYTLANTFVVCYRCNRIKADATWRELKIITQYVGRKL
jgi:hypothetical protein